MTDPNPWKLLMNPALPPAVLAESKALDFLNSVATPQTTPFEWIVDGAGLLDWLSQSELVPDQVLQTFRAEGVPGELDAVANQIRALREWFRGFVLSHMGRPIPADVINELAPLNRVLARDDQFGQIVVDHRDGQLAWRSQRRWRSGETLMIPIAQAMAELITSGDFVHVKACQGHDCSMLFVDRTRGRARRWCSMGICGNRAKQAAHRDRRGAASNTAIRDRV
ncbi:CGNR zinc finger domain-containing protein [Luteibacter pinisoli]|nr:ABATE domain-containing protein [Luteibacter pinisoli]